MLTDTEVRLLSNLFMQIEPGALLGSLDKQNTVFSNYWPLASAHSFRANSAEMWKPTGPAGDVTAMAPKEIPVTDTARREARMPPSGGRHSAIKSIAKCARLA
ncbi:MAG: hypothetical protein Q7K57_53170 [Burkholderiaceae bacterium]|nr:hypothetical protein [Burkholderiaceae bacterium]